MRWNNFNSNGWWYKDGYNSGSKDVTLNLPGRNYCFDPSKSYHLWYAEDEHDSSESDNHGTAKTDVLVKLVCPKGYYSPQGEDGCKGISGVMGNRDCEVCWNDYERIVLLVYSVTVISVTGTMLGSTKCMML